MVGTFSKHLAIGGALTTLMLGCGDAKNGGTGPDEDMAISLALSPTGVTVEQGGSADVTATVTSSGGFNGSVTITVEGVPAGVSVSVGDVQTSGVTTTAAITIHVEPSVSPGAFTLTVRAMGSAVPDATAELALSVQIAPFKLSVSSGALTIPQGQSGTAQVNLLRSNFTDAVMLALEGAPAGVTAGFDPNPVTGVSSTLSISVANSVTPGTYPLTIRGTASGHADQTVGVDLTVTAAVGAGLAR